MDKSPYSPNPSRRNRQIDEFRRSEARREVPIEAVDELSISVVGPGVGQGSFGGTPAADLVLFQEIRESIQTAVADLPSRQSTAVRLKYFEGLTAKAIADRTGQPIRTIENDLKEGRASVESSLVRGGIFHPEFGLAGFAIAIPSKELLSLSHGVAAATGSAELVGSGLVGSGIMGAGFSGGFRAIGKWPTLAKVFAVALGLVLTASIVLTLTSSRSVAAGGESDTQVDRAGFGSGLPSGAGGESTVSSGVGQVQAGGRESVSGPAAGQVPPQGSIEEDAGITLSASSGLPALPVALVLTVTDHGLPVTGMKVSINYLEGNGGTGLRRADGSDPLLDAVEEPAGVYTIHGDHVGERITFFAEAPMAVDPAEIKRNNMARGPYTIRVDRLVQAVPEHVDVHLQTEERCFAVALVEGQDYSFEGGTWPGRSERHVTNLSPAVWLVSLARGDYKTEAVELTPGNWGMRWKTPYAGKLTYISTAATGGGIFHDGGGGVPNWTPIASSPVACD